MLEWIQCCSPCWLDPPHNKITACFAICSVAAEKEKLKPKKAIDLFDEDDEDGDIFSDKYSTPAPAQSKKEVVEEQTKPAEKKVTTLHIFTSFLTDDSEYLQLQ